MKRGQIVTIAAQSDFAKSRPALIIQSDSFNETRPSVTVLLVSCELVDAPLFRINLAPNNDNGLNKPCQIMVDKPMTVKCKKIGALIGKIDDAVMLQVNRAIVLWMGLA